MATSKYHSDGDLADTEIYPDMGNYVGTAAEFLAAVDKGLADLDAGRTVSFEEVAAEFQRNRGKA
jgi:predicted transcriptional regulator